MAKERLRVTALTGTQPPPVLKSTLLNHPPEHAGDLALLRRATKSRWEIPADAKPKIVDRLLTIVGKTETLVVGKDGDQTADENTADQNSIAASKVLISLESQIQKDEHHSQKLARPAAGVNVHVGLNQIQLREKSLEDARFQKRLDRVNQSIERREQGLPALPPTSEQIADDESQQRRNLMKLASRENIVFNPDDADLMERLREQHAAEVAEFMQRMTGGGDND